MSQTVVIGAGHNGLISALYLARAGRKVVVLERSETAGGLAAEREISPGFRVPGLRHDEAGFREWIVNDLGLARHGLGLRPPAAIHVGHDGAVAAVIEPDAERTAAALSDRDAEGWRRWQSFVRRVAPTVCRALDNPPPPLDPDGLTELVQLGRWGLPLRRLGRADFTELLRVGPMPVADWLDEHFADGPLAAALALPAVAGTFLGPRSAGTAAGLLRLAVSGRREVAGGPAALVRALVAACEEAGVEIRLGAEVTAIGVDAGTARAVSIAGGESVEADTVIAACDPKQALLELVDPAALAVVERSEIRAFRSRGTAAKVHLALSQPFRLAARPNDRVEHLTLAGGRLDDLERAADAVKYGEAASAPALDVRIWEGAGIAPEGEAVVSALVWTVPHAPRSGWGEGDREALREHVLGALEAVAPGTRSAVVGTEILGPADLEAELRLTGGHIHHGEHALDQILLRPTVSTRSHATPIDRLFLASGGTHPGGGLTGVPGALAARAALG